MLAATSQDNDHALPHVNNTPESQPLANFAPNAATKPLTIAALDPTMPLLPIPVYYYMREIQQLMTLKRPMLMHSFQHKNTQFMPSTLPTLEVASPSITSSNPAPCTTLLQSLQLATAHDLTQFGWSRGVGSLVEQRFWHV